MRKISILLILISFLSYTMYAQLEVNDTLLLAFENEIFWGSSSELEMDIYKDFGKYGSSNLGDSDPNTCWAEGSESSGNGEYVWMTIPENTVTIRIRNGYQKSEAIHNANNRPKELEFELFASYEPSGYVTETHTGFCISELLTSTSAVLEDKLGYQDIELGFNWPEIHDEMSHDRTFDKDRFILKIKISSIYKGEKWDDACISDINIIPNPYFDITTDEHGLLKVSTNITDTLFYESENVYQVVELSPDLEWIIFILIPSDIENSRVETEYKLYNTEKEKFITPDDLTTLYGFIKNTGKIYLGGSDNELNDKIILLENFINY